MTLEKDMIREPQMWQLVMEIGPDDLRVMAFSPMEHHSLISEKIPFERGVQIGKAFQDAVYDNPMLLSDFRRVTVLYPARRFMVVPDVIMGDGEAMAVFRRAFPADEPDEPEEVLAESLPGLGAGIMMAIPAELLGFIRRTFNNPRVSHTLVPLALYFKGKHPTRPRGKMLVNLRGQRCDVVILGDSAPLVLNSFPVHDPMDAVYYVMACREGVGLAPTDEIILAGEPDARRPVAAELRRFVRYVMPAIFPSVMCRAGSASLRTPFEMVVAPIIE